MMFIKWYCKSNENFRSINPEKLINSAKDLKLMVRNLWWELVINISKFLSLSAFPTLFIKAVIAAEMLMRGKSNNLSKEVSVPESIRAVYSRCQINKPLYVSVKHDNLIN